MKRMLGVLLTVSSLVVSAACAASRASSKPEPSRPDAEESWAMKRPVEMTKAPANAAASNAAKLASR